METTNILIPVSVGELYDKYSILIIKQNKIHNADKQAYISVELNLLKTELNKLPFFSDDLLNELLNINEQLWTIEDSIRAKERNKEFDEEFIKLARSVYNTNDLRFNVKNKINLNYNSKIFEVKSYENYN